MGQFNMNFTEIMPNFSIIFWPHSFSYFQQQKSQCQQIDGPKRNIGLKLSPAKKKAKKFDFSAIVASCIDEEGEKSMEEEMGEEKDIKGNDPCQNGTFTSLFDAAVTIATAAATANNSGHSMHNRTATMPNHPPNQPW